MPIPAPKKSPSRFHRRDSLERSRISRPGVETGRKHLHRFSFLGILAAIAILVVYAVLYFPVVIREHITPGGESFVVTRLTSFLMQLMLPESIFGGWTFYGQMPIDLLDRPLLFGAAAGWLALAWRLGKWSLEALSLARIWNRAEAVGLCMALGLSILSMLTLVVGLLGLLHSRWPLLLSILVVAIGLCWRASKNRRMNSGKLHPIESINTSANDSDSKNSMSSQAQRPHTIADLSSFDRRCVVLLGIAVSILSVLYLLGAVLPPVEFDVREYHLQAPKEFYQNGRIGFLSHNIYANMPLGAEMHALSWMTLISNKDAWFSGALIGKIIIASFAIITAILLGGAAYRFAGHLGGYCAASFYLASPGIAEVSRLGLIDAVVGCYLAAFLVVWLSWQSSRSSLHDTDEQSVSFDVFRWGILAGSFLGSAAACKYTAIPFLVLPGLLLFFGTLVRIDPQSTRNWKWLATGIVLGGIVCGGLWYVKNMLQTGNPVYPLGYSILGGRTLDENKAAQWHNAHKAPPYSLASGPSSLLESVKSVTYHSRFHGLLLIPMAIIGFAADRSRLRWSLLVWMLYCVAVWWLFTHRLDRFWLPFLPLLVLHAGMGATWLARQWSGVPIAVSLVIGISWSILHVAACADMSSDNRLLVSLEALRNDRFESSSSEDINNKALDEIEDARNFRVPKYQRWLNANLHADQRVLIIGDAQVFDVEVACLYSTCFDESPFETATQNRLPREQWSELRKLGVTHVVVHWSEIDRYRSPGNYGFSNYFQKDLFAKFVRDGVLKRVNWPIDTRRAELYELVELPPQQ